MEIMDPRVDPALVPPGSRARVVNGPNDEYQDLPSVITPGGTFITRWTFTDAERAAILRGEDVYLAILTYNRGPLQPVSLTVGPRDWTQVP